MVRLQLHTIVLVAIVIGATIAVGGVGGATVDSTQSPDDSAETTASAFPGHEAATFEITSVETNAPLSVGERLEVTVEVENTGSEAGEGDVWFDLGAFEKDRTSIELDGGESTTVELTYVTRADNVQNWNLRVSTPDDTTQQIISVEESRDRTGVTTSGLEIVSFEFGEWIEADGVVVMNVTIENKDEFAHERLLWGSIDNVTENETVLEFEPGETRTVPLSYNVSAFEGTSHTLTAETPDDIAEMDVGTNFVVDSIEVDEQVAVGEVLAVTVDVTNEGAVAGEEEIALELEGSSLNADRAWLAPGASTSVTLNYITTAEVTGDLDFAVTTEHDRSTFVVTVGEGDDGAEDTADDATDDTVADAEDDEEDPVPGFGVLLAFAGLAALTVALGIRRR